MTLINKTIRNIIEFGDYQTPPVFAQLVCQKLREVHGLLPKVVIEPTFGVGNFFNGILDTFSGVQSLYGIEINPHYFEIVQQNLSKHASHVNTKLFNANIFTFDFDETKKNISKNDCVLIIGNPPWVTNSQLSSIDSCNVPIKENFKGCTGLEAMTGKGNFDITENIILRLLNEFSEYDCTVAMLCKTIIAKNIVRDMKKYYFSISAIDMYLFDATEH
jgi:16S rRNA A1518/A1519 N6-dimethyltransferase RsmA/KsgA/DIM1 with predicted DNA glycosylase/AP lyase activity